MGPGLLVTVKMTFQTTAVQSLYRGITADVHTDYVYIVKNTEYEAGVLAIRQRDTVRINN
jgi:hypothetical protein